MKNNKPWTAGTDLGGAPPPPPPPAPHHLHTQGPKPHEIIIEGLEAISAQVVELTTAVEEIRAAGRTQ